MQSWQWIVFVALALIIGGFAGSMLFGGDGGVVSGECNIDDVQSEKLNHIRVDDARGYIGGLMCNDYLNLDSSWDCYLDDVDPLESTCSGAFGCSTFNFNCACFKNRN